MVVSGLMCYGEKKVVSVINDWQRRAGTELNSLVRKFVVSRWFHRDFEERFVILKTSWKDSESSCPRSTCLTFGGTQFNAPDAWTVMMCCDTSTWP